MNSSSTAINNIITQNIPLELPSNFSKTFDVDVLVNVDGEETTHSWQFDWRATRFTSDDDERYCYEFSLSGEQKDNFKYGKSFYKIKIKDTEENTKNLVAPNYNRFVFRYVTFNYFCAIIKVNVILKSYTTDSPPQRVLKRTLDCGSLTDVISTDNPPRSKLKRMLDSGNLTDVVIKTKSGNFPCHKFLLASASEYFETMFSTDLKEKKDSVIDWVGVFEADVVRDLLDYLYTGQTPPNFPNTCTELMKLAHMCLIDKLKTLCGKRLKAALTVENMGDTLRVAAKYEAEELQEATVNFIVANFDSNDASPPPWDMVEPEFGKNLATTIIKTLVAQKMFL